MLDALTDLWNDSSNWVKQHPFAASVIASLVATLIFQLIFRWPTRILRWLFQRLRSHKKKLAPSEDFPFERIKPEELGQWLLNGRRLTYYKNPFVPKTESVIYSPDPPGRHRRRIFLGAAEIGKTRAAYEWICGVLQIAPNAEILTPASEGLPYPIKEEHIKPPLAKTVVLFYDDLSKFLLPAGRAQQEREERILSAEDRFEDLIELLESKCTLYVVATARWESHEEVQPIESCEGIWRTFEVVTLEDAPPVSESKMIEGVSKSLGVEMEDGVAERMASINSGHSYENTVLFLQDWKVEKQHPLSHSDLKNYERTASQRWEDETFEKLRRQDKLVSQLIGAMYTIRFELGLPLYERFVLQAAVVSARGCFRKRKLHRALGLLCQRGGFRRDGDMVSCYDFQLGISARAPLSAQDCLKRLCRRWYMLPASQRRALAEWHLHYGLGLYNQSHLEDAAEAWERSVVMRKDLHEAYNNWGVALYELALLRQDEGLFQQSFQKCERAVEIKEGFHEAYYNWGNALSKLALLRRDEGLFQQSFQKYKRAVEIKEDFHQAYNNWGAALYELARLRQNEGLFEQGIEKSKRAVEIREYSYQAYYNWGNALSDLANLRQDEWLFQQSFQKYKRAVEIKKDFHKAYNNWGFALYELALLRQDEGLFEQSFQKYERAVEIKEDYHEAYSNWGVALYELALLRQDEGLFEQSIEKLKRAVEISPGSWEGHFNLACCYAQQRLAEEACKWLDRAISLSPGVADLARTDSDFDPIRDTRVFQEWCQRHVPDGE